MTAPNLLESSEQAELYRRGSDTLLASFEEYARGATGAAVHRLPGVAAAVFPDEPERAFYNNALLQRDLGAGDRSGALDAMESVYAGVGVARFAAWVHESDEPMRAELERRGYTLDTTTRAMGMDLDDIALPRPQIPLGPADWPEYLRMDGLPPDFLSAADHAAIHLLAARIDGEMVAAALAYDFGDDCGIYNVGTVEKARRRGLGTALTTAQVYAARPRLPDREPAVDPDGRARVRRRGLPRPRPHPGIRPHGRRAIMSEVRFAVGDADADLAERLDKEISEFNAAVTGHHDGRMLSVAVRGDDGDLRAGLYGWTWGGCGYIDLLWVRDDQRGSGLGARLLAAAEAEIRHRGCDRVALNTHSFQAPGFYARFGYRECGRTPGYPHGHDDIHLLKLLG